MWGHHMQRIVDVDKVQTLMWRRKCAGWTTRNKLRTRLKYQCKPSDPRTAYHLKKLEQGTRYAESLKVFVWSTKERHLQRKGFENLCEICHEGSFMAQCGLWYRMENHMVAVSNGENKGHDEIGKDKILCKVHGGVHCKRKRWKWVEEEMCRTKPGSLKKGRLPNRTRRGSEVNCWSVLTIIKSMIRLTVSLTWSKKMETERRLMLKLSGGSRRHTTQLTQTCGTIDVSFQEETGNISDSGVDNGREAE